MDVNTRISNFYNSNPDKQKYIKGVTASGKVLLKNEDKEVYATLDELENNTFNWSQITGESIELPKVENTTPEPLNVQNEIKEKTNTEFNNEQPVIENTTPVSIPQTPTIDNVITPDVKPANNTSLADVRTLADLSKTNPESKSTLDQIIKTFAVNENGEVDLNKAQQIVQNNGIELAVDAIKNQKGLPSELYKYKADGSLISSDEVYPFTNDDAVIDQTFNNALLYAGSIPEEQLTTIKEMYKKMVYDKLQTQNNVVEMPQANSNSLQKSRKLELTPTEEKAGFADIFILVLIVAVYAVIIINLILKIK